MQTAFRVLIETILGLRGPIFGREEDTMKLIKKILLATDFTDGSNEAARTALQLASRLKCEVVLVHVLPKRGIFTPIEDRLRTHAKERLEALKERMEAEKVEKVTIRIPNGDAHREIIYYAESLEVSLVVLGGVKTSTDDPPRLGTTAERVIRDCRIPVWVARPDGPHKPEKILCPVDMSEHSARALRNGIGLAKLLDTSLDVLHVVSPLSSLIAQGGNLIDEVFEDDFFDQRTREFEAFLTRFEFGETRWNKVLERGNPADLIVEHAESHGADLIIMGSVGRTGLSRLLMGSVATKVARAFPCSVLTVKDVDPFLSEIQPEIDDSWLRYEQGQNLLEEGRTDEAIEQFQICISRNRMFVAAWDGLTAAYKKAGNNSAADRSRETASAIRKDIWERKVENEIRARTTRPGKPRGPRYDE